MTVDLDAMPRATAETILEAYRQYVATALWSSLVTEEESDMTGEPLDSLGYTAEDLSAETAAQMLSDVASFLADCWGRLDLDLSGMEPEQIGHDLWLTANRHGAGFWDRGLGELGDTLTSASLLIGGKDLYVGDDGLIHH